MKIIDLLNKIANEEELPKKICCFNREFYLKENIYFGDTFTLMHYIQEEDLNDEVEILEEEKKIPGKINVIAYEKCIHDVTHKEKELALEIRETQIAFNEIIDFLKQN